MLVHMMLVNLAMVSEQSFGLAILGFFQVIITALIGAFVATQANRKEKTNTAEAAQRAILDDKDRLFDERLAFKDEIIRERTLERDEALRKIVDQRDHIERLRVMLLAAENKTKGTQNDRA